MEKERAPLTIEQREAEIADAFRLYKEAGKPKNMLSELVDLVIRHTSEAGEGSCRFEGFACSQLGDKAPDFEDFVRALLDKGQTELAAGRDIPCAPDVVGEGVATTGEEVRALHG